MAPMPWKGCFQAFQQVSMIHKLASKQVIVGDLKGLEVCPDDEVYEKLPVNHSMIDCSLEHRKPC